MRTSQSPSLKICELLRDRELITRAARSNATDSDTMLHRSIVGLALVGSAASFSLQGAARLTTSHRSVGLVMDEVPACHRLGSCRLRTPLPAALNRSRNRLRRRVRQVRSRATSGKALRRSRCRAAPSRRGTSARSRRSACNSLSAARAGRSTRTSSCGTRRRTSRPSSASTPRTASPGPSTPSSRHPSIPRLSPSTTPVQRKP